MTSAFLLANSISEKEQPKNMRAQLLCLKQKSELIGVDSLARQPASAGLLSLCSSSDFEQTTRKLILIDWDDTLNPSSWCMRNGILTVRPPRRDEVNALSTLATKVLRTLNDCMELGHVVIVTNAEAGWVELSARFLMPEVHKKLKQIPVISARSNFQKNYRDSPTTWKSLAFSQVIAEWVEKIENRMDTHSFSVPFQVVSIGDSSHERKALFRVHSQHRVKFSPKSVKLIERPTISDLERQHEAIHMHLGSLLRENSGRDLRYQHGRFEVIPASLTARRPQSITAPMKKRRTSSIMGY